MIGCVGILGVAGPRIVTDRGLPSGPLHAMGVTDAMMEPVAAEALKDHCHATNPRAPAPADYLRHLDESR